ncbi:MULTISPECIES: TetR/AcrR family transcriptional regulator [Acinetobacter]|uniref:TetR/AcrR family transcriptional regulator n=1 Tax=Acinetobacter TaxID=469 RepID=UPI00083F7883|nr:MULTISPECIES: TetR/AcrR family transcriptional regulator [Acinetobacter]MDS7958808.1 helix-turn-helix domain-containing protein [Acinetobacter sp. V104_13]MDS7982937.1 helix-turn-helix domain-containing protein [Acinetobacter sp. V104_3]ODL97543.1 TetR family transcriptional regulator [Acinetobacter pittii]
MKNLQTSFRALRTLHTATDLFKQYGFNKVGVDRIIAEAQTSKATFYNIFHSKERLIERCLIFQKDALKDKVISILYSYNELMVLDKLKQIYLLHTNLNGLYYLLFKAIFEIKTLYPIAYRIAIEYRTWLVNEIYKLLLTVKTEASVDDARMFLFVVDGGMIQLLSKSQTGEQDKLVEYFLVMVS